MAIVRSDRWRDRGLAAERAMGEQAGQQAAAPCGIPRTAFNARSTQTVRKTILGLAVQADLDWISGLHAASKPHPNEGVAPLHPTLALATQRRHIPAPLVGFLTGNFVPTGCFRL
ncbi:hypothetical protein E6C67_03890 (plasmid) [Azospirillum sp. TSA2s]|uniref:hypothetical protein n=1 Tax=Azospirillum sp. TSA2s TaxID=709810 RepID=UPI0010AA16D2|nr:hypothetical protein [Azospirillum sp. TSA2s]QCG93094.1 hypothetical protein E6C67_03890 [Azospirillum sp. TSA2s]